MPKDKMEELYDKQTFKIPPNPKSDLNSSDSIRVSLNYNSESNDNSKPERKEKASEINKSSEILNNKNSDNRDFITLTTKDETRDAETVEKIANLIPKCNNDTNVVNNPRTKKQMQVLLSRNGSEQQNYCSDGKTNESVNIITDPLYNNTSERDIIDTSSNLSVSIKSSACSTSKYFEGKAKIDGHGATNESKSIAASLKDSETLDEKYVDRSRFEEIENKLEEMFAGIEDEYLGNTSLEKESNSEYFGKEGKLVENCRERISNAEFLSNDCYGHSAPCMNKSSLPTKAAMKSTVSFCTPELTENDDCRKNSKPFQHLRTMPLRRRLSIEIGADMIKLPNENIEKINCAIEEEMIQDNSTSKKICSQRQKEMKAENYTPTYKGKKNNRKSCLAYKHNSRNKKNKPEIPGTTKQKLKQRKLQRFLPSDNDEELDEKNQQSREIDNKNRSPFILVNSNGSVTVVNTLMQDDFNDKYTRTRKSYNYVYERKTVKGCHSSTLSNRYDADTADSSWICVFCKNGPHKKGLGDLFGPYIISTQCEEYQSYKDFVEILPKNRRTDAAFLTGISSNGLSPYNKTMKILNENSVKQHVDAVNVHEQREFDSALNYSLGMIKTSESSYEIWVHEDCVIWTSNIFIIGSRLTGLEEAIWNSISHKCCYCSKFGALVCCLQRDCKIMAHVPCARDYKWLLDESTFWTLCSKHIQSKNSFKE